MISKNSIGLIRSLEQKKARDKYGLFLAEGDKICSDLLTSDIPVKAVYFTRQWALENESLLNKQPGSAELMEVSETELGKISLLTTPNKVLAMAYQQKSAFSWDMLKTGPVVLIDQVQDPGNLGTIIRTADWFGFHTIVAAPGTVDFYNPKVIQSAMGSAFRVMHFKYDLETLLRENLEKDRWPVYATTLGGENLYSQRLEKKGFYLFGNEANGISQVLQTLAGSHIVIPQGPVQNGKQPADSLNVAVAAAVVMAEFARQEIAQLNG